MNSCSFVPRILDTKTFPALRRLLRKAGKKKLAREGALEILEGFVASRSGDAFAPDFADLWFLYSLIRQRQPRVVLEFGSGCSTVILSQALWVNESASGESRARLYSVDADPYWAEVTSRSLPAHLRSICAVSYNPVVKVESKGVSKLRHASFPQVVPNFVYLDGPALGSEQEVAVDVLDMEDKLPDDFCMVVDGRRANTLYLQKHLKRKYKFTERRIPNNYVFKLLG